MRTAFVLSGGGSLASVQVGMLQALGERGIRPDLLVGTSAGAINAAHVAGFGCGAAALDALASLWVGMRRGQVFPLRPARGLLAVLGRVESLCSPEPLRALLASTLPFDRLEDAVIPLHVVTTDVFSGREVMLSQGDAVSALLASAAIPGIFPAVRRGDDVLCDGALADNSAISQAVALGANRVYVLPSGTTCALDHAPAHPLAAAMHAVSLLLEQRVVLETRAYAGAVDLHVLPPLCPLHVSPLDFSRSAALIAQSRRASGQWLDSRSDELPYPERFLSLHDHRAPAGARPVPACCRSDAAAPVPIDRPTPGGSR